MFLLTPIARFFDIGSGPEFHYPADTQWARDARSEAKRIMRLEIKPKHRSFGGHLIIVQTTRMYNGVPVYWEEKVQGNVGGLIDRYQSEKVRIYIPMCNGIFCMDAVIHEFLHYWLYAKKIHGHDARFDKHGVFNWAYTRQVTGIAFGLVQEAQSPSFDVEIREADGLHFLHADFVVPEDQVA